MQDQNVNQRQEINVIKLCAMGFAQHESITAQDMILGSVQYLYQCWKREGGEAYTQELKNHIHAYLEMGFLLSGKGTVIREIAEQMELDLNTLGFREHIHVISIHPTEYAISCAIGKWPITKSRTCTKPVLVRDILTKVKEGQQGTYHYQSCYETGEKEQYAAKFKLVVSGDGSRLFDILRQRVYTFIE